MKKELFEGLEKARKEFNQFQGKGAIMVDFDDMTAWSDIGQMVDYEGDNVFNIVFKDDLHSRNDRYGVDRLNAIAQTMINFYTSGDYSKEQLAKDFEILAAETFYTGNPIKA